MTEIVDYTCFQKQSTIIIAGLTNSGKSVFTKRLIEHKDDLFKNDPVTRILFCYAHEQNIYDELEKRFSFVTFFKGLPSENAIEEFSNPSEHTLLILDDLMSQGSKNKVVELMFTQICHHLNMSIIFIVQNMFLKSIRTVSLNAHFFIIFRNLRDTTQIACLARQIYGRNAQKLLDAYKDATARPYSYLLIDISPHSDDRLRLRTDIFPDQDTIIYL